MLTKMGYKIKKKMPAMNVSVYQKRIYTLYGSEDFCLFCEALIVKLLLILQGPLHLALRRLLEILQVYLQKECFQRVDKTAGAEL